MTHHQSLGMPRARLRVRVLLPTLAVIGGLGLAGCGSSGSSDAAASSSANPSSSASSSVATSPSASGVTGTVTVLAAASLTESFNALATSFEAANPGVTIKLSYGSSTTLAKQIAEGAPADLYASAGEKALEQLSPEARAKSTTTIATNSLEIAVPRANPGKVTGLPSLSDQALQVVLCAQTVPCGSAADTVLKKAGINPHVVSREVDVKATLAKITLGEADAAIVYVSDVKSAGAKVKGVPIAAEHNTVLKYPLVQLTTTPAAEAFAAYLAGPAGVKALAAAGFHSP